MHTVIILSLLQRSPSDTVGRVLHVEQRRICALLSPLVTFRGIRKTAQWLISQMVWYETVIIKMIARKPNGQWKR